MLNPKLTFASDNNIKQRATRLELFLTDIFELPWAMVTDESKLHDFEGLFATDVIVTRVQEKYNHTLLESDWSRPLWELLDDLELQRKRILA